MLGASLTNIPLRCLKYLPMGHDSYDISSILSSYERNGGSALLLPQLMGYAKPRRLLPASEVTIILGTSLNEVLSSIDDDDESCSLYLVHLKTSRDFGSSLSDSNAAILICLIDVNGDSILQRIPAIQPEDGGNLQMDFPGMLRFQRGYDETLTFKEPKLGNIEAFWIGVELGSWRLGGVSLTVINPNHSSSSSSEGGKQQRYGILKYGFEANSNISLGGDISMVELRPTLVTEVEADVSAVLEIESTPISNHKASPEESMKEYADLKLSLLLYDAMLVFAGSSIAASTSEKAAKGFLVGGIIGFLYLVLLQKSVDGLSGPELSAVNINEKRENDIQILGGFKGPVTSFALVLILTALILKYGSGFASSVLTPQELLAGAVGFLTCKVAVVLAAFRPMKTSFKKNE
ncbi:hypothetical protein ACLOJK_021070 [Asimina triloba]